MVKEFQDRSDRAKPIGEAKKYLYGDYYFGSFTTKNAISADPGWADAPSDGTANVMAYDEHNIYEKKERNADYLYIKNDAAVGAANTIFVRIAFSATANFSKEFPVYPGERWVPRNVYAARIRSATQGVAYRVSEFEIGT